jgi:membrane protease YdiL (CAAX protease family)
MSSPVVWPTSASRAATWVGLIVALAGPPVLAFTAGHVFGPAPTLAVQVAMQLVLCAIAAVVALVIRRRERLPVESIGIRRPALVSMMAALGLVLVVQHVLPLLTTPLMKALARGDFQPGLETIARQPLWWRVCVAVTSGPIEEILYRGYAVERLATLTGRLSLGGLIATLAFAAAHIPFWGVGPAVAADLPFGGIMVAFYLWRRDLGANAAAHAALLLLGMLAVPVTTSR